MQASERNQSPYRPDSATSAIFAEFRAASPSARLWRLHHAIVLATAAVGSIGLPFSRWCFAAPLELVGIGLLIAAGFRPGFRQWFTTSDCWWTVPAAVLLFPLGIFACLAGAGAELVLKGLVPLIKLGVAIPFLVGLVPRRPEVAPGDWAAGLWRLWIPAGLLTLAGWTGVQWRVYLFAPGPVSPLTLVMLGYCVLIWETRDRLDWPRMRFVLGVGIALLFLWHRPDMEQSRGMTLPNLVLRNSLDWVVSIPLALEALCKPGVLHGLSPFASSSEFAELVASDGSNPFFGALSFSTNAGYRIASVLPFLLLLALAVWVRRRWVRALWLAPVFGVVVLCGLCLYPPYNQFGLDFPGPWVSGYLWRRGGWKLVGLAALLGAMALATSEKIAPPLPLPRSLRRARDWGLGAVAVSFAISLLLAFSHSLVNGRAARAERSAGKSASVLLDKRLELFRVTSGTDPHEVELARLFRTPIQVLSTQEVEELGSHFLARRQALREFAGILARDLGSTPFGIGQYRVCRTVQNIAFLEVALGELSLERGDLNAALEATSTSLRVAEVLVRKTTFGTYQSVRVLDASGDLLIHLVDSINSSTEPLNRPKALQSLNTLLDRDLSRTYLPTGETGNLWPPGGEDSPNRKWPKRIFVGKDMGIQAPGSWFWDPIYKTLVNYLWARTLVRILVYRDIKGGFPDSWIEVERSLGRGEADGILPFLDAPFALYLTMEPISGDRLQVTWSLPLSHPLSGQLGSCGANVMRTTLLGPEAEGPGDGRKEGPGNGEDQP